MKTNIVHVAIHVRDLNAAIQWYEETLGFTCADAWPRAAPTYAHFEQGPGPRFALRTDAEKAGGTRVTFEVEGIRALWEGLNGEVDIEEPLYEARTGHQKFAIRDPDGNDLIFQE